MLQIHTVPAFQDNYLWMISRGQRAAVVDPGDSVPIEQFLQAHNLELAAILATHHHGDHVGGLKALAEHWRCPVFGPAREKIEGLDRRLVEGERITVPGLDLELDVLDVPGHTAGHIAYVDSATRDFVFCGDTMFACGCGRLFEGTPEQMSRSLAKLASLPAHTRVYCAHEYTLANIRFAEAVEPGNARLMQRKSRDSARRARGEPTVPSTIGEERETNPFIRCTEPEVVESAERHAGHRLDGPTEVFAEIRAWKNNF